MKTAPSIFAELRNGFPGVLGSIYLDVAARGLISKPTRDAINDYLDHRMLVGADKAWMFDQVERTRESFARLIGADADEIALTKNVSDGINAFATSLAWNAGDNVVFCEELEHPANVFPWYNLAKLVGIRLKAVPSERGQVSLDRVIDAIDGRTKLVTVSSVSFSPGFRFPLEELGAYCSQKGICLLVDAAQSVGILDTDVRRLKVDALATSTQKGLLGLYGAGFLYVRRHVAETLRPRYLSRSGVQVETAHEAARGDVRNYRLARATRRFDVGNPNFLAAVAVGRSIEQLQAIGMMNVEKRVCGLANRLGLGIAEAGLSLYGGSTAARAHIVTIGETLSEDHDSTRDDTLARLYGFLTKRNVKLTIRRGVLRLSVHIYNDESDIDATIGLIRTWSKDRRRE